jgi:hypothetical protein
MGESILTRNVVASGRDLSLYETLAIVSHGRDVNAADFD